MRGPASGWRQRQALLGGAAVRLHASVHQDNACALLLGADRKVRSDADFVLYNQPVSPGGAVELDTANHQIRVDLARLATDVETVLLVTHGPAGAVRLTVTEQDGPTHAVSADATTETVMICAEVYRRQGAWRLRAVARATRTASTAWPGTRASSSTDAAARRVVAIVWNDARRGHCGRRDDGRAARRGVRHQAAQGHRRLGAAGDATRRPRQDIRQATNEAGDRPRGGAPRTGRTGRGTGGRHGHLQAPPRVPGPAASGLRGGRRLEPHPRGGHRESSRLGGASDRACGPTHRPDRHLSKFRLPGGSQGRGRPRRGPPSRRARSRASAPLHLDLPLGHASCGPPRRTRRGSAARRRTPRRARRPSRPSGCGSTGNVRP
ncbi:hypothetical protein E1200_16030 [Actinomadura sp. GC306]|nr:hypothetical protein E1200_16030 [Actinomadura sp. GC306]